MLLLHGIWLPVPSSPLDSLQEQAGSGMKVKRSQWHKKRALPEPEPEPEPSAAKKAKIEAAIKLSHYKTALEEVRIEWQCTFCKKTDTLRKVEDEGILVCTACATVDPQVFFGPGYDDPWRVHSPHEAKEAKTEMKLRRPSENVAEDNIKLVSPRPGRAVMAKPRKPKEPQPGNVMWTCPDDLDLEVHHVWEFNDPDFVSVVLPTILIALLPSQDWWRADDAAVWTIMGYLGVGDGVFPECEDKKKEQEERARHRFLGLYPFSYEMRRFMMLEYDVIMEAYEREMDLYRKAYKRWNKQNTKYQKLVYQPRKAHFIDTRLDNIDIASFVDRVLRSHRVGLAHNDPEKPTSHPEIRTRAIALANLFLRKQTVIDRNRETLAAVCVSRAACEHSLGLRYWDVSEFVADGAVFNAWRRDLRKHATLSPIARQKQLVGFLNLFVGRVVFAKKKDALTQHDRAKIHAFGKWLSGPRMHRVASEGPHAARKLPCLKVFLDKLASEQLSASVPPLANLLPDVSKVEGDKFIKLWSIAATVVYMVLSVRPHGQKGPSQKDIYEVSGVHTGVQMACKRTLQYYIQKAQAGSLKKRPLELV